MPRACQGIFEPVQIIGRRSITDLSGIAAGHASEINMRFSGQGGLWTVDSNNDGRYSQLVYRFVHSLFGNALWSASNSAC